LPFVLKKTDNGKCNLRSLRQAQGRLFDFAQEDDIYSAKKQNVAVDKKQNVAMDDS
jgi:hypothetical protein